MAYNWDQWNNKDAALAEIARAGQVYNEAQARGDRAAAEAAHRHAQGVRQAAGIQGDGRNITGLEGTVYAPKPQPPAPVQPTISSAPQAVDKIEQLAQARLSQQPVRETPYFVEMQFDPRRYEIPKFEPPKDNQYGIVTPALLDNSFNRWLKQVEVLRGERSFDYGMSQDSYNRRDAEKRYNEGLALDFSKSYGVPIKPMGSLENLFAQVRGIKPLNIEERDYQRKWNEDEREYNRTWNTDERTYNRDKYTTEEERKLYTNDAIGKMMTYSTKEEAIETLNEMGQVMADRGVDMAAVWNAIKARFPDADESKLKIPIPTYDPDNWDSEQDYWDFVGKTRNP